MAECLKGIHMHDLAVSACSLRNLLCKAIWGIIRAKATPTCDHKEMMAEPLELAGNLDSEISGFSA
jgi:hypothetical protein